MSQIDQSRIEILEKEFKLDERGLTITDFVRLVESIIPHLPHETLDLRFGLQQLFTDIDINGDGRLEWSEFNQYIIDQVISQSKQDKIIDDRKVG